MISNDDIIGKMLLALIFIDYNQYICTLLLSRKWNRFQRKIEICSILPCIRS